MKERISTPQRVTRRCETTSGVSTKKQCLSLALSATGMRIDNPTHDPYVTMQTNYPRLAFSRHEAAEMLGVCEATIDRLVRRGLLKPSRATRRPLFSRTELERFLGQPQAEK